MKTNELIQKIIRFSSLCGKNSAHNFNLIQFFMSNYKISLIFIISFCAMDLTIFHKYDFWFKYFVRYHF